MARATKSHRRLRRGIAPLAAALTLSLAVTACGSESGGGKDSAGNDKVTAGVVPAMPAAAIYVGLKEGLFEKEKVALTAKPAQTGAAVVASLLNGELQVGYISSVVAIRAIAEGVPIRFAAGGDVVPSDESQQMYGGLVFSKDTKITDFSQLEGKTVAVNALQGVDQLALSAAVDAAGGDQKKVKVVEVPYPEQWSAVKSGRVDAAVMSDPFYTDALAQGGQTHGNMLTALGPGALVAGYVVSDRYAEESPDAVKHFVTAMNGASALSNKDADLVRSVIPEFSHVPADKAKTVILPQFSGALDEAAVQTVIDLMVKYGYIKGDLDAADVIAQ